MAFNERQQREIDYHADFARQQDAKADEAVPFDIIEPGPRRPWNGHWVAYDMLMAEGLDGKRVMVPGCGFGDDAIRLAKLGAHVYASELSPDLLNIARKRSVKMGMANIHFDVMAAEALSYPDNFFDIVYFNDILHHVDIPMAIAEARRVLKPAGRVIANELYTHSSLQRVRQSRVVSGFFYRRMVKFIYGSNKPYITEDEHKIDEHELAILEKILRPERRYGYFLLLGGRLLPKDWLKLAQFERALFGIIGSAGRIFAGRIVVAGTVEK